MEGAWEEGVLGEGVNVAVVDSGLFWEHEDLRDNVDTSRNHDYTGEGDVYSRYLHHGTNVAGIIAGRDNSVGVRGVAPRSTIYTYNLINTNRIRTLDMADAMLRNYDVTAVSNNSWGPEDDAGLGFGNAFWELGVETGVTIGYEGKGIFYAFAAGNGHRLGGPFQPGRAGQFLRGDGGVRGERGGCEEQLLGDGGEPVGMRSVGATSGEI